MKNALRSWAGVAGLARDAATAVLVASTARILRLVDDAHDTDPTDD